MKLYVEKSTWSGWDSEEIQQVQILNLKLTMEKNIL